MGTELREERDRLGLKQSEVAEKINVGIATYTRWEGGKPIPSDKLALLAKLGVDVGYVVTGQRADNSESLTQMYSPVPMLDVEASAGHGSVVMNEQLTGSLVFSNEWFNKRKLNKNSLAVITARGDSMHPTILSGEALVVDVSPQDNFVDGIYVIRLEGDLLVKRLQKQFSGGIEIISDNPAYKTQFVPADQLVNLDVVGRVVWMGKDL